MKKFIEQEGFDYKFQPSICETCEGNCCIGESGYIWINKKEIELLAEHLDLSLEEFSKKYLLKVGYKYSLIEKRVDTNNYACIFFDLNKKCCTIYDYRPKQCRTFPFWDYFKSRKQEVKEECPAIKDI